MACIAAKESLSHATLSPILSAHPFWPSRASVSQVPLIKDCHTAGARKPSYCVAVPGMIPLSPGTG